MKVLKAGARIVIDPKGGGEYLGGQIAITRTLGDLAVKDAIPGLIPDPDTSTHFLQPDDYFVVICSDGVWDVFSSEEAVGFLLAALMINRDAHPAILEEYDFVDSCRKAGEKSGENGKKEVIDAEVLENAAMQLVKAAIERGSTDNCSAVIICMNPNF